jgi:hypothetical protein
MIGFATVLDSETPLDPGIAPIVEVLFRAGIETFESCQGGEGHAYPEPTVRFHGQRDAGWRALAIAHVHGFNVQALRRTWPLIDGEPTGPYWEMVFRIDASAGEPDKAQPLEASTRPERSEGNAQ